MVLENYMGSAELTTSLYGPSKFLVVVYLCNFSDYGVKGINRYLVQILLLADTVLSQGTSDKGLLAHSDWRILLNKKKQTHILRQQYPQIEKRNGMFGFIQCALRGQHKNRAANKSSR